MNAFWAMAWNGFREARRNRVTVVVGAFLAILLLSSNLVTEVTVSTFDRVLTDFGLGMMSLILVFLAVFLSSGLLSKEIERRTVFLVVSKPVSRAQFLLARVAGNMLTLGVLLAAMTAIFFLQLAFFGTSISKLHLVAIFGLYVELFLLTAAGVLMSSFAGTMVSALAVIGVYLSGHLAGDVYDAATRSENALFKVGGKILYYLLPNLERVNFRSHAAYGVQVAGSAVVSGVFYILGWSALMLTLAVVVFNRRDFR